MNNLLVVEKHEPWTTAAYVCFDISECTAEDIEKYEKHFDVLGRYATDEEYGKVMKHELLKAGKENTLALHKGLWSLDIEMAMPKYYKLPWFFFVISDQYVKYLLDEPDDERIPVVGNAICYGPYHVYDVLTMMNIPVRPATKDELEHVDKIQSCIVLHDKVKDQLTLPLYWITAANDRDPSIYFESDEIPPKVTDPKIISMMVNIVFIRNEHPSTLAYLGEEFVEVMRTVIAASGLHSYRETAMALAELVEMLKASTPEELQALEQDVLREVENVKDQDV